MAWTMSAVWIAIKCSRPTTWKQILPSKKKMTVAELNKGLANITAIW